MLVAEKLPFLYRVYKPIDMSLMYMGNVRILGKSPLTILRNYINRFLFKVVFVEKKVVISELYDNSKIFVKLNDQASASLLFEGRKNDAVADRLVALSDSAQCFIDVGSNYGYFTVVIGRRHPEMSVIAVEPNPQLVRLIRKSVYINSLSKVQVVSAACGDCHGEILLNVNENSSGVSYVSTINSTNKSQVTVDTLPVDDLFLKAYDPTDARPVLLKIDVEGFEVPVFKGASKLLASKPIIVCELNKQTYNEINNIVNGFGLSIYKIDGTPVDHKYLNSLGRKNVDVLVCSPELLKSVT
ncbi:hypothetical protein GEOBRER4_n2622 [Citrifermentans bremense]|uniref:Methyltransferase FkbM domain-containing protein n=1 Tax=Citrifermentans bremense TaxID=60035 RepID=A0A6S6M7D8_9BACT|nr:FkbM family methyltransferase [Citrifermentans bremense]BCG47776.1 hypothetical protein GEOBRER4_n2622 [Citrifermentans bremense]